MTDGKIKVGTFFSPSHTLCKTNINAYTLLYSIEWDNCIEYSVSASSGKEAKKIAINLRLQHEQKEVRIRENDLEMSTGGEVMSCENCEFSDDSVCFRYPIEVDLDEKNYAWCGEWKKRTYDYRK